MEPLFAGILIASVPSCIAAWASVKSARIVNGNGRGNVTKMVEELVDWKNDHEIQHQAQNALLVEAIRKN